MAILVAVLMHPVDNEVTITIGDYQCEQRVERVRAGVDASQD